MRRHVRELVVALKTKPLLCASPPPISLSSSNSLSFLRRPPSSCATMINENNNIKNDNSQELETIFKQKKLVRSRVRKALKAMEPSLRSHEGNPIISSY
ncbi:hypothetical protein TIFTF001_051122 [Ficus carica]|uniref:Uncharacterized protein n=1 Tax=Ficus carica TaxID=3494 RepID=A0AA87YYG7_FICCA|nr:hypothetical protein TIFTF001_051104 [Ficus carica]GMN21425.1 hypothetical protein TIFTF001_051122 [Ficus carica]